MNKDKWHLHYGFMDLNACKECGAIVPLEFCDLHEQFHTELREALAHGQEQADGR